MPKTLFGEKYVELEIPPDASSRPIEAGDVIEQSKVSIEVEKVLNDTYPLLTAVEPVKLSYTLNALSTALEGRGDRLGENLVRLDSYLKQLNPLVPSIVRDLQVAGEGVGPVSRRVAGSGGDVGQPGGDREHGGGQAAAAGGVVR